MLPINKAEEDVAQLQHRLQKFGNVGAGNLPEHIGKLRNLVRARTPPVGCDGRHAHPAPPKRQCTVPNTRAHLSFLRSSLSLSLRASPALRARLRTRGR